MRTAHKCDGARGMARVRGLDGVGSMMQGRLGCGLGQARDGAGVLERWRGLDGMGGRGCV